MSTRHKSFEIQIGETHIKATLLEEKAPKVCNYFWESLPIESFVLHSKFAGDEIFLQVPYVLDHEYETKNVEPGDIAYYGPRETICIFYGEISPFGAVNIFAKVLGNLDRLKKACQEVKKRGAMKVYLRKSS